MDPYVIPTSILSNIAVLALHTVDGTNPENQLRLVVYPIIYEVSKTSQVLLAGFLNHQQYHWIQKKIHPKTLLTSLSAKVQVRVPPKSVASKS